jgi:hypothetical protein
MVDESPGDAVRSHWLAMAVEMLLTDRDPGATPVTLELQTGDQPIVVETHDGAVRARLGVADQPDATLAGPARPIMGLLLGLVEPKDAGAVGVAVEGDPAILERIATDVAV